MKKISVFAFLFFLSLDSFGSNAVGGEITFQCLGVNFYQANVSILTKSQPVSTDMVVFDWGDSNVFSIQLFSGVTNQLTDTNYYLTTLALTHMYAGPSGPNGYPLSAFFKNYIPGISNIPNSNNDTLFLFSDNDVDPVLGNNNSPYFISPNAIQAVYIGQNDFFNENATDPDGDSLSYALANCNAPGYTFPTVIGGGNLVIDPVTGICNWNNPTQSGIYNMAIEVTQWKHFPNGTYVNIGYVTREIEINVTQQVGMAEQKTNSFFIFPNPVSSGEKIHFEIPSKGNYEVEIHNASGALIYREKRWMENRDEITLPQLSPGHYHLIFVNENGQRSVSDFIITPN